MPVLQARTLAKTYLSGGAQVRALDGVDLTVERGRVRRDHGTERF